MGIGAYQVREFVEKAGGEVHVKSESGRGTVFRLCFPDLDTNSAANGKSEIDQSNQRRVTDGTG
jgi:signal transduction histidine kinase